MPTSLSPAPSSSLAPWLTLIGIGEDGLQGLSPAAQTALARAEVIFGAPRHLDLARAGDRGRAWPVPFSVAPVVDCRGRPVVVLASGDPFWFGVGGSLVRAGIRPEEWRAFPAPSTFSLIAARMGWPLEQTACLGLHAAPLDAAERILRNGGRAIVLLRDGQAVTALAQRATELAPERARITLCERMGGPLERIRRLETDRVPPDAGTPLAVAVEVAPPLSPSDSIQGNHAPPNTPAPPGIPDPHFAHDGQITKAPVRALTLAALRPQRDGVLWDLGAGSGSVSVEWCLSGGCAFAVERRTDRQANIAENARRFGIERQLTLISGAALDVLDTLPPPDAVFVGGGGTEALFSALLTHPHRPRIVANAVALETQALLIDLHKTHGGRLMKIDLAEAAPLGRLSGWAAARTLIQWVKE